ncbi:MAG: hypothetical protein KF908_05260 [Nitrosomonas sp.]|nr:hypothetical protein [Nitrosomonas sp.]
MRAIIVTPPAIEPVSIDEVIYHARIDNYNQDGYDESVLLNGLIRAAREQAEHKLGRYLITQTVDAYFDAFPVCGKLITLPPVQSITNIKYIDTDGILQTVDALHYYLDRSGKTSRIGCAYGYSWPSSRNQSGAVIVRFVGGYGDAATDVPASIKNWMLLRIKTLYDKRDAILIVGGTTDDRITDNTFADGLLDSERVWWGVA